MSEKARLRNRIVGSVIVFTAAIIILPSILDGEKISYKDDFKTVPERPQFETVQNNKPFPDKAFEQNMPKPTAQSDEVPVDVDELEALAKNSQVSTEKPQDSTSQEVLNNDTLTVSTMSRPADFQVPDSIAADEQEQVAKAKPNAGVKADKAKSQATQSTNVANHSKEQSPFTQSAWVIQLGSFGQKANALAIEKKLNDAGYTTFTRQIKSSRGPLTKVYVGPELDKKILVKALPQVNKIASVNGIVTSFTIRR